MQHAIAVNLRRRDFVTLLGGRKVAAFAQLGDAQLHRAGARLPRPVAVAVALGDPLRTALAMGRAGQPLDLQLHQALGVLKPAEQACLSVMYLGKLVAEAGIPAGVVNIVPGYGAVAGAALVAHHMVAKVMFTGSTVTGKRIAADAANTLKPVGLELGGKSAVIVYEDAPIDQAAQVAAMSIFSNQGQICTAGSRLFLHEEVHDKVLEKVVENAKRVKIGDQMDPSTTMGPLISVRQ